jgi:hypothetical protein
MSMTAAVKEIREVRGFIIPAPLTPTAFAVRLADSCYDFQ